MKHRILCAVLALTLVSLGFSACGKAETDAADPAAAATTAANAVTEYTASEEDGQNPVMNFIGPYQHDRCSMLVEAVGMDQAKITVQWSSDAWTHAEWSIIGKVIEEGEDLVLRYTDGAYAVVTTDEDGNETRSDEKDDSKGSVLFKSDYTIVWTDYTDEQIRDLVFEFTPSAPVEE